MPAGLAVALIGLITNVAPSLIDPQRAEAARLDPISCGQLYAVGHQGKSRHVYTVDRDSGALAVNNTVSLPARLSPNGLAVDAAGGHFWMVGQRSGQDTATIVRVDATTGAQTTFTHPLPGAPAGHGGLVMGALNPGNGIYYFGLVSASNVLHLWGFDTRTDTAVPGVIGRVSLGTGQGGDFAFDRLGRLYVVSRGVLMVLNEPLPATGSTSPGPELAGTVIASSPANPVGSMAFGPDGYVYVAGRTLYRVNPSTGDVAGTERFTPAPDSIGDMASCASPTVITLVKDLPDGRHQPGDQFRLSITGGGLTERNTGLTSGSEPGLQDRTPGAVAGPAPGLSGATYTITEAAAGTTDLAHYRSTWKCTDRATGDTVADGTGTTGRFVLPGGAATGAEVRCTFRNSPRGSADLELSKSVDPVSGSVVTPGQTVGYRLTFSNSGTAPAAVAVDEVIAELLDDATLTAAPVSTDPALTVSDVADGRFTVSGSLAAGRTATISYAVEVKPDGKRGDDVLGGFLVASGEEPADACAPDNLLCTENPVPAIEASTSVDREDGSRVRAGQVLTYTLAFTNTGAAPAAVGYEDVIAGLLDDATPVSRATSSDPGVIVSAVTDGRFSVSGTVNPGRTVTVSYAVRVKPDGRRGDGRLDRFLIETGAKPPGECRPASPTCTSHPVTGAN